MASFSVVSNIASANAQANLHVSQSGLERALGRLSSGYRINLSGDDSAGLAVANKYRNDQAILNQPRALPRALPLISRELASMCQSPWLVASFSWRAPRA